MLGNHATNSNRMRHPELVIIDFLKRAQISLRFDKYGTHNTAIMSAMPMAERPTTIDGIEAPTKTKNALRNNNVCGGAIIFEVSLRAIKFSIMVWGNLIHQT